MTVRLDNIQEIMLEELTKKLSEDIGIKLTKSDTIRIAIETYYKSMRNLTKNNKDIKNEVSNL